MAKSFGDVPTAAAARRRVYPHVGKNLVTTAALARHLVLTDRRVQQLVQDGILQRRKDGRFDQDACRVRYIKYLQTEGRRVTHSDARDRAQEARARALELRNAREEGKLIEFTEVEEVIGDIVGTFSSELGGVPASCTRDLALRDTIEGRLNAAVERMRSRLEEAAKALQAGQDPFADDEEAAA